MIAESAKKTDKLDAQVLAEFLARDMIPEAFRPTPRQREHRALVRHRRHLKQSVTALKNKMRRIAADYNADRKDLFTAAGWAALQAVKLSRRRPVRARPAARRVAAPGGAAQGAGRAAQGVRRGGPGEGGRGAGQAGDDPRGRPGDRRRGGQRAGGRDAGSTRSRRSARTPGWCRRCGRAAARAKDLGITKAGSPLLRWALVEAAWRVIRQAAAWRRVYERVKKKAGGKKAIVAVARRLLVVMAAMLRDGTNYNLLKVGEACPT